MRKINLLVLIIISVFHMYGIELNLDSAVKMSEDNNIGLKRSLLELEGKSRGVDAAYNVFYPNLSGNIAISRSNNKSVYQGSDTSLVMGYELSLNITPALFEAINILKRDYELGLINYLQTKRALESNVKQIFYNLILLQEQKKLLDDTIKTMKSRYEITKLNYDAGLVSEIELLKVQVSYENLKPELNNLINVYNSALANFKIMLGIDYSEEVVIIGTIQPEIISIPDQEIVDQGLKNSSTLLMLNKTTKLFESQKKAALLKSFLPVANISYSSGTIYNDGDFTNDNGSLSLAVFFSFSSLLPNSKERVEMENLDRRIEDINLQNIDAINSTRLQVINLLNSLKNSIRIQEGLELTVSLAKKSLTAIEKAYISRTTVLLEVQNAQNEYNKARLELLKEQYYYTINKIKLDEITASM